MEKQLRILVLLFKLSIPLTFILFPCLFLYGEIDSWPRDQQLLEKEFSEYRPFLSGIAYENNSGVISEQRSYILIPTTAPSSPKVVTVFYHHDSATTYEESTIGFYFILIVWILSGFGSWYFWIKKSKTE